ncbi:MAG: type II secretion protein ATPase [Micavibrio sp.]|nr:type II secretion protein ATPase [Micavibrio sp.]|tara:strand:- start:109 stop:1359 length:1251 start_codon:yes stop_codon:yes gene_type:complete
MSEADTHVTATLLPQSRVAVFSRDKGTLEAARSIQNDWRFARVEVQVEEGDVQTATQAYSEFKSPDILIIQTDTIDEGFVPQLEGLAAHCDEGTEAIIVGPDNDVNLYRKLIDMGVRDYLVRPVVTDILAEVIAKTLIDQHGVTGSRLVAFIGAKGGVGTSTIARNFGLVLSNDLGQKTMLVDASGGWSSHPVGLGFEPSTTYKEAAKAADSLDEDSLARMMFKVNEKYMTLATGGDVMLEPIIKPPQMEALLEMLMVKYPAVIADISASSPELRKLILSRANDIVLVSNATVSCLRLARSLIMEIKDIRGGEDDEVSLFLNMHGLAPANELSSGDILKAMELEVDGTLPFDPKTFMRVESEAMSLAEDKTGKEYYQNALLPYAARIFGAQHKAVNKGAESGAGVFSGLLGKIGKK